MVPFIFRTSIKNVQSQLQSNILSSVSKMFSGGTCSPASLLDVDQSVNALTADCVDLSVFGGINLSFSAGTSLGFTNVNRLVSVVFLLFFNDKEDLFSFPLTPRRFAGGLVAICARCSILYSAMR